MFNGVKIYNNRPRNYIKGGYVSKRHNMTMKQLQNDSISAILKPGEIVIPIKYTKLITKYLNKKNIKLPNM